MNRGRIPRLCHTEGLSRPRSVASAAGWARTLVGGLPGAAAQPNRPPLALAPWRSPRPSCPASPDRSRKSWGPIRDPSPALARLLRSADPQPSSEATISNSTASKSDTTAAAATPLTMKAPSAPLTVRFDQGILLRLPQSVTIVYVT